MQERDQRRNGGQAVDLAGVPRQQDPPVSIQGLSCRLAGTLQLRLTNRHRLRGIPSYAISFTTKSSRLSTSVIRGGKWHSQAYQAWTGVVPQGPPSDSNQRTTDECGNVSAGYSGQWRYCELVANGVRLLLAS